MGRWKVSGSISASSDPQVEVSLSKTLNPKSIPDCCVSERQFTRFTCMCVCVWKYMRMHECDLVCKALWVVVKTTYTCSPFYLKHIACQALTLTLNIWMLYAGCSRWDWQFIVHVHQLPSYSSLSYLHFLRQMLKTHLCYINSLHHYLISTATPPHC